MDQQKTVFFVLFSSILIWPFVMSEMLYDKAVPFSLRGPDFLGFFGMLSITVMALIVLVGRRYPGAKHIWTGFLFLIGIARVFQGMSNHRPVGYLLMMLLADAVVIVMLTRRSQAITEE